jgi:hypothetical protein
MQPFKLRICSVEQIIETLIAKYLDTALNDCPDLLLNEVPIRRSAAMPLRMAFTPAPLIIHISISRS